MCANIVVNVLSYVLEKPPRLLRLRHSCHIIDQWGNAHVNTLVRTRVVSDALRVCGHDRAPTGAGHLLAVLLHLLLDSDRL